MTGVRTATGAMTDRRPRPLCTSTGDAISRANRRPGVAVVATASRSTVLASGSIDPVERPDQRSCASRGARTDAEGPRVMCRLVLRFVYSVDATAVAVVLLSGASTLYICINVGADASEKN